MYRRKLFQKSRYIVLDLLKTACWTQNFDEKKLRVKPSKPHIVDYTESHVEALTKL